MECFRLTFKGKFLTSSNFVALYCSGLSFADYNITEKPEDMLQTVAKAMGGCGTGNPIDDCWRCDPNWQSHRQALASCALGFGRNAIGGKNGPIYTVTSNADDPSNPAPGTLRYGVTRNGPLWITFAKSMTVQLKAELWVSSYKTIDGRGVQVHIHTQVTIKQVSNVIIHGIYVHDVKPSAGATIRVSPTQVVHHGPTEGDALHIWGSHDVWVDHVYLARATDGLCDITKGSTDVTVSNSYLEQHDKVRQTICSQYSQLKKFY
jgi:pectate lyase